MTTYRATNIGEVPVTAQQAGEVIALSGSATISITSATIAAGEIAVCTTLPADHVLVDFIGDISDADSGTSLVFKLGFVDCPTASDNSDAILGTGYTTGQAGGLFRPMAAGATNIAAVPRDRRIGITVTTLGVAGGTAPVVKGTVLCRKADTGRDR